MIRSLLKTDVKAMAAIDRAVLNSKWNQEMYRNALDSSGCLAFGSFVDEALVGFILVRCTLFDGEIHQFAIHPDYHRQGHGDALMKHTVEAMNAQKLEALFLEVASKNKAAIAFYSYFGFEKVGYRRDYYDNDDAWIMERRLI